MSCGRCGKSGPTTTRLVPHYQEPGVVGRTEAVELCAQCGCYVRPDVQLVDAIPPRRHGGPDGLVLMWLTLGLYASRTKSARVLLWLTPGSNRELSSMVVGG